jgi:hypothetical protein
VRAQTRARPSERKKKDVHRKSSEQLHARPNELARTLLAENRRISGLTPDVL